MSCSFSICAMHCSSSLHHLTTCLCHTCVIWSWWHNTAMIISIVKAKVAFVSMPYTCIITCAPSSWSSIEGVILLTPPHNISSHEMRNLFWRQWDQTQNHHCYYHYMYYYYFSCRNMSNRAGVLAVLHAQLIKRSVVKMELSVELELLIHLLMLPDRIVSAKGSANTACFLESGRIAAHYSLTVLSCTGRSMLIGISKPYRSCFEV